MEPENRLLQLLELLACAWWHGYVRHWPVPHHFHAADVEDKTVPPETIEWMP